MRKYTMPRPVRRRSKKTAPRKPLRKLRLKKSVSMNPQNQHATSLETVTFRTINENTLYQHSFNLAQFPRSSAIAACYKFCRPVEVCYEYTPLYNVFQENSSGGPSTTIPLFFSYMNRTGDTTVPTDSQNQLDWLLSTGTRPRPFNRKVVMKYKPNWLSSGVLTWAQTDTLAVQRLQSMGAKAEYGWIPCPSVIPQAVTAAGEYAVLPLAQQYIPDSVASDVRNRETNLPVEVGTNTVNYQGHYSYIRQTIGGNTPQISELRITVKWEFKNPNPQFYLFQVRDPELLANPVV